MDALGLILAAVPVLLVLIYVYLENRKYPPGPYGVPLFGYLPFLEKNFHVGFANLRKRYGNVVSVGLGSRTLVVLNDFEAIREALVVQGDTFSGRANKTRFAEIKQKDILFSDGFEWKGRKRNVMRTLTNLGVGKSSIENNIVSEVDKLSDYLKLNASNGQPIEMIDVLFLSTLNIISMISYGKRYERDDEDVQFIKEALDNIHSVHKEYTKFLPILKVVLSDNVVKGCQQLAGYVNKVIDRHEKEPNVNELNDLTSTYLAEIHRTEQRLNGSGQLAPFTRPHLVGSLTDMLMAGLETNESTLLNSLLYMAHYPQVQRKVQEELEGLMTKDSALSMSSKKMAPYTQATIMEVHRCSSVVPLAVAHRTIRDTVLLGHKIPCDTMVFPNLYAIHNDERHWGDPNVFRPERFLDADGQVISDNHVVPFSLGPRQCMGIALAKSTVFIFFTCLLRRFTFSLVPGQPKPSLEPANFSIIAKPKPFSLIVTCRD